MPTDTHPDADEVQFELLRQMTPEARLEKAFALSAWTAQMSRRAIAEANPELSDEAQRVLFVEVCYGKEIADRFQASLRSR